MNDITNINANRAQINSGQSNAVKNRNQAKLDNNSESENASDDRVTLTSTASRLKDIEQKLNSGSAVDSAKVAEVKSAIANGDYKVDADRIADKMLAFEDDFANS